MRSTSGGWVSSSPKSCADAAGTAEEHVAGLLGPRLADGRAGGKRADLLECPGDAVGIARELHRRGVGQELTLP